MNSDRIEIVALDALLDLVRARHDAGWRLVQISATRIADQVELTYSFDLNGRLDNLRLSVFGAEPRLPSISGIYGCAILYENEIHDLFNVQVDGLAVDFKGNFYKLAVKFPFGSTQAPRPPAAPAPKPTP